MDTAGGWGKPLKKTKEPAKEPPKEVKEPPKEPVKSHEALAANAHGKT